MIEFPCNCGHAFTVTDDQAGTQIQCPDCKRLNDIPTLSDLQNLEDGGIYKMDSTPINHADPHRVAEMTHIFTRNHYDAEGTPIDIRGPIYDGQSNGPVPVESLGPLDKAAPKYDPLTGELVEELEIKPDEAPPPTTIPLARQVQLGAPSTVHGIDIPDALEAFTIPIQLFQPANLLVIFFILCAHLLGTLLTIMVMSPLALLVLPVWALWHGLILAHYGNVVDETGPTSRAELPTPLRHLGWHEDIWAPFIQVAISLIFCYAPAVFLLANSNQLPPKIGYAIAGAFFLAGVIAFPAVLLTMSTSGTVLNARPDRLLGVMVQCGVEYVLSVIFWIVAASFWVVGMLSAVGSTVAGLMPPNPAKSILLRWYVAWSILAIGTYLMHLFCWHIGTLYRRHFLNFPWILQRHEKANRARAKGFEVQRPARGKGTAAAPRVQPIRRG